MTLEQIAAAFNNIHAELQAVLLGILGFILVIAVLMIISPFISYCIDRCKNHFDI